MVQVRDPTGSYVLGGDIRYTGVQGRLRDKLGKNVSGRVGRGGYCLSKVYVWL